MMTRTNQRLFVVILVFLAVGIFIYESESSRVGLTTGEAPVVGKVLLGAKNGEDGKVSEAVEGQKEKIVEKEKEKKVADEKKKEEVEKEKEEKEKEHEREVLEACTVFNPHTHNYVDLRSLSALGNEGKTMPWTAKGYDSGVNFTLGVCSNPFKRHHDETDLSQDILNSSLVGGYYIDPQVNKYVSIGQYSTKPVFRGKKLTLTYTDGSYCDGLVNKKTGETLRKSTILSFTCAREMMSEAAVSYVGSVNNCTYFFEVRSHHACPTAAKADNLAVIWIFFFFLLAALMVFFLGGSIYRIVKLRKSHIQS